MIAAECAPFAKTGGLADVVGVLPRLLQDAGHRVMVVMPRYALIDGFRYNLRPVLSPMGVWMGNTQEWCSVQLSESMGFPVYFVESRKFFDRPGLYHDDSFNDYQDNPRRFAFLTRAGLQLCKDLAFKPDIVHVHDWHTAPGAAYLKIWDWNDPILGRAASVLTIHNIAYQGVYDAAHYPYLGLQLGNFTAEKFEDHGRVNFLKGGIFYADMLNTVSPTYARETRTPELGYGLAPYLNNRGGNYVGILNGVDYQEWNPATDALIPARFQMDNLTGKEICKAELQARFGLQVDPSIPIFGVVSRFVEQKGLDLLAGTLDGILATMRVQFVVLGSGEKSLERYYGGLPGRFPGRVGSYIGYHNELAHWIEAGADFFVMPSRYEPCGLNQMYSLKYGTLPVVRATGGLEDTVEQYDERSGTGTGFKFIDANPTAVYYAIGWAVSTFYDRKQHIGRMVQRAMSQDFSWQKSSALYERLYARAIQNKQRSG
jgi:starch synthase